MRSSYKKNNYHKLIARLAATNNSKKIVECGILDGLSLLELAKAASKMPGCMVYGFDLFDSYEFKHGSKSKIEKKIKEQNLQKFCKIKKQDAFLASQNFEDNSVDFLHVDISNDGEKLKNFFYAWDKKIKKNAIVVFEGGSEERDNVSWMKDFKKIKIEEFKKSKLLNESYEFCTIPSFPSITICRKL